MQGNPEPLSYYHESGSIAAGLNQAQDNVRDRNARVGIVGLGTGSLACFKREGEEWTFFEIDNLVVETATDPSLFSFVSKCSPRARMVLGDARITLEREPDGSFDYLLIDAFSSDAIPVHLLTVEAIQMYMEKLSDDGILAIHITNRHLELESVVAAIAESKQLAIRFAKLPVPVGHPHGRYIVSPKSVVLARGEEVFGRLASDTKWSVPKSNGTKAWSDNYSDVLSAFLRNR